MSNLTVNVCSFVLLYWILVDVRDRVHGVTRLLQGATAAQPYS